MNYNIRLGRHGENLAVEKLLEKGYEILSRNYRVKFGEIDIIARDRDILVFIEVKTRRNNKFAYGFESVDFKKQKKIQRVSLNYLLEKRLQDVQMRYDIIEVYTEEPIKINHIIDAY